MQSFQWKRKHESICKLATGAFNQEDKEVDEEEIDWLTAAKKPKVLALEDALAKAERLKKEGVILADGYKWWSAIRLWSTAVSLQPSDHTLHEMIAQAYIQVGEYVPSIASGELAVSNAPLWWCGYQTLGRALLGVGELHRAVLCFSRALRLRPDMGELRDDDLQWAHTLLTKYRQLQKSKEISDRNSQRTAKAAASSEEKEKESLQIIDLKEHPEGFLPPTPHPAARDKTRDRSSISDNSHFVSCCSSNKSGKGPSQQNSDSSTNCLDLSKMVCMRPKLPDR